MIVNLLSNLSFYVPELICILTMCGLLLIEAAYKPNEKNRLMIFIAGAIGLVLSLVFLSSNLKLAPTAIFSNSLIIDQFSTLSKMVMALGTLGVLYINYFSKDIYEDLKAEFVILAMGILVGGMLLSSANNMLTLYLGVETLSILSYVMSSMKKRDASSSEAGLKYALYGGIAAGIMLFGISHIYGVLGTIQFTGMAAKMQAIEGTQAAILLVSFLMFFVGIGYKVACVPFHMWSPDVYQGSPIPVTALFSIVPKVAGIAAILRVTNVFFGVETTMSIGWIGVLQLIAALTMTVGNVTAIGQDSVKRLLAYSSIAHAGNMLLGVVVLSELGVQAILFYGMAYLFMTLTAFFITSFLSDKYGTDSQMSFRGLIYKHPFVAIFMSIILFSLAGLPPFSGFIAKFNIITALVHKKYFSLAIIAVVNSLIALYYYTKLVRTMIFDKSDSEEKVDGFTFQNQLIAGVFCVPVIVLGVFWESIMSMANQAKLFIN